MNLMFFLAAATGILTVDAQTNSRYGEYIYYTTTEILGLYSLLHAGLLPRLKLDWRALKTLEMNMKGDHSYTFNLLSSEGQKSSRILKSFKEAIKPWQYAPWNTEVKVI